MSEDLQRLYGHLVDAHIAVRLAGGKCQQCRGLASQVHHLTYERLGCERLRDLMPICEQCHQEIHEIHWEALCPTAAKTAE